MAAIVAVLSAATTSAAQPSPAAPAPTPPGTVVAHHLTAPIRLDGRLDDPVYASTPAVGDFLPHEPFEGQRATEKTDQPVLPRAARLLPGRRRRVRVRRPGELRPRRRRR